MNISPRGDVVLDLLLALCAVVVGACLGSFANVLIHRLPRNLDWVRSRSACPGCEAPVRWYDNIPLLSWILLRGHCRDCGENISPRYFLVELAGALCGLIGLWRFGPSLAGVAALLFLIDLIAVALIDWKYMIIPHTLTVGGMALGLALASWNGLGLQTALLGLVVGAGIVLVLAHGYRLLRGQIGMGGGDVMLMGMVGAFLGAWGVVLVLFGGALLGSLYALLQRRASLSAQSRLPFGTFLAAAAGIALLVGEPIRQWYVGFWTV